MLSYLLFALLISLGINIVGFLVAFRLKTDKLTDFSYALSFIIINFIAYIQTGNFNLQNALLFWCISLWGARLGTYLVIRIKKWGRDKRFDEVRNNFFKFLQFWVFQAITVWVVSISSLQFYKLNTENNFQLVSILGLIIFFKGLIIETFADLQLFRFSLNPKNKGKFINQGLWSKSRHPNYLGEITVWTGLWIYTLSSTTLTQGLIGLISPVFIFLMIRFISGVPKLEKNASKKWGSDKDYQEYKKKTGLILPKII